MKKYIPANPTKSINWDTIPTVKLGKMPRTEFVSVGVAGSHFRVTRKLFGKIKNYMVRLESSTFYCSIGTTDRVVTILMEHSAHMITPRSQTATLDLKADHKITMAA